ncbi:type II secretion system protein [Sulfurimonas sp. ST-27]|uniref:type II secretion system protein n=1 Tax=unclassified Sulfurimonas TaxID=2623549 RepID=UPI003AB68F81
MKNRFAFTMLELVFVIVIMGIIGKFGVEFLAQAYNSFIFSKINHELQSNSEAAVELIAKRLEGRIKDSVIAREANKNFDPIGDVNNSKTYAVLEWIGSDTDGFRGISDTTAIHLPNWSGIIDLDAGNSNTLVSPETNTTKTNTLIAILSSGTAGINDSAIFFTGADSDIRTGYGWDTNTTIINAQKGAMHPVQSVAGQPTQFTSSTGTDFSGVDIYEYYKLAWTAYAVAMEDYNSTTKMGNLYLYHNYQPWQGEQYDDNNDSLHKSLLMQNVSTFRFTAIGSIMKIQVCTKTDLAEEYSLCKEKTVF